MPLAALAFCKDTLLELEFGVVGVRSADMYVIGVSDGYEMVMFGLTAKSLCYLFSGLVFLAVALPAIARPEPSKGKAATQHLTMRKEQ